MMQVSLDSSLLIIQRADDAAFLSELAMMLIERHKATWVINNTKQGFKATVVLIFGGNMTAIDLDNQLPSRNGQLLWTRWILMPLRYPFPDSIGDVLNLNVVIDTASLAIQLLKVVLSFSVTMERALLTLQFA